MHNMPDEQPLALSPPYFAGRTDLRVPEHYHGGIPIRAVEGDLQVIIDPWLQMSVGDKCEMFFVNLMTPVWEKEIYDDDLNKRLVFRIPRGFVIEGDVQAFYRVTRVEQAPVDSQPTLMLLVKLQRPGGFDDDAEEGHSGLRFELPELPDGVTLPIAEQGVDIRILPYENMAAHDYIIVRWGSQEVHYLSVTQEQVDDPERHPIIIKVECQKIVDAGDGPDVQVTFQVIDRVGNYPDERAPWAKVARVLVDLESARLTKPTVLVDNRPVTTIDLEQLGDSDVIVRVFTRTEEFAENDKILVTWSGMPAQGKPIIVTPAEQNVDYLEYSYQFEIPNASVRALAKGAASVRFARKREGEKDALSLVNSVTVIGEISQLAAPAVQEAPGSYLDPEAPWATNEIPWYAGRKNGDQINLFWEATRPGGAVEYHTDSRPVDNVPENTPVLLTVTSTVIKRFNGLQVSAYYTVANDDVLLQNVRKSLPLSLQVGVALPTFAPPQVVEAEDGSLDPDQVPPAGATLLCPHLGTLADDRVAYVWRGSNSNGGSTSGFVDLTSHTAGTPVKFYVNKTFVTANLNGTVAATYTITRNGQPLGSSGELNVRIGTAQAEVPPPTVIEAPVYVLDPNQYQQGFTVRFDTSKLLAEDEVELTVIGRPGDGSTLPEPKQVAGQAFIEFNIVAAITGANLGRSVDLSYRVIRAGQGLPVQTRALTIGTLLQRNMPQPLIEGMTGEVLDIGLIKDDSKVLCGEWPFQRSGLLVWLSYMETFASGGSRTKDQLVGAVHDQTAGLNYTTEVQWLRECKEGSTVSIVLKVGLFVGAGLGDAVECRSKGYSVKAGFEDLTNFNNFQWNNWMRHHSSWRYDIVKFEDEFFMVPYYSSTYGWIIWIMKQYYEIDVSAQYSFSFDYRAPVGAKYGVGVSDFVGPIKTLTATSSWTTEIVDIRFNKEPFLYFTMASAQDSLRLDNLRLKKVL